MDNIYGIELPSDALPVVTGKQFIICKTRGGELKFVTAAGSYNIVTSQNKYQVGAVVIRADNVSPASIEGGTWQNIAQSRAIIGASDAYPLGSTGGEETHNHAPDGMWANLQSVSNSATIDFEEKAVGTSAWTSNARLALTGAFSSEAVAHNYGIRVMGNTTQKSNLQPYLALNIWQKISD